MIGETALHCAAQNGHLEVVRALIEAGADANVVTNYGIHLQIIFKIIFIV
jgi:ankyrin repeat protein